MYKVNSSLVRVQQLYIRLVSFTKLHSAKEYEQGVLFCSHVQFFSTLVMSLLTVTVKRLTVLWRLRRTNFLRQTDFCAM